MKDLANPYSSFLQFLESYKNDEQQIFFGVVVCENPLEIQTNGIKITKKFIRFTDLSNSILLNKKDEVLLIKYENSFILLDKVVG